VKPDTVQKGCLTEAFLIIDRILSFSLSSLLVPIAFLASSFSSSPLCVSA
jgi:hypothetical protein